jgi:cytochrome P450
MSTQPQSLPAFCAAHTFDSWSEECPQKAFAELAGQTAPSRADGTPVVAARAELIQFLRHPAVRATDGVHHQLGAQRPLIPLDLDGTEHRAYRKVLEPLFAPRRMALLEQAIRARTRALIDGFVQAGEVDLMAAFCGPLPSQVFIDLLGLPAQDLPVFLDFKEAVVRPQGATLEEQQIYQRAAGERTYAYLTATLADRRSQPERDDLLAGLLAAQIDGNALSDQEIIDICYLLVIAGLDTVTSSLSCALAWFAGHPDERAWVIANPDHLPAAIEELIRYESPVPLANRWVTEDIEIGGRSFPANSRVEVVWAAANVDPAAFPDALSVDLARPHNAHVGYAAGPHRCLGSHLARLELRVAIEEFHRRIPDYEIAPGRSASFTNYGVRAAIQLPIRFPVPAG